MNNDYFSKFHQSPRPEFAKSLYAKLKQDVRTGSFIGRHPVVKRMVYALVIFCLAFAIAITVSPTARAAALAVVDDIVAKITMKGITVIVNDDLPPTPDGTFESYSVIWAPVKPQDISAEYPFLAKLPTWLPSGYILQERAALYHPGMFDPPDTALFEWKDNTGETIQLRVMEGSCPNGQYYDPDGSSHVQRSDCTLTGFISVGLNSEPQVVELKGQPAVLFSGVPEIANLSDPVKKWNPVRTKTTRDGTQGMWMIWENDGRTFELSVTSGTITKEDFLRLAESIP